MKLQMTWALLAGGIVLAALTAMAAATSGSKTLSGTIVTSGVSGTRTVISSVVILRGVFNDVGRIVELPNDPSQPDLSGRNRLGRRAC